MSYISVELRHVLSCVNDEGMILSLENALIVTQLPPLFCAFLQKRNNQALLSVLHVDKQMYIHVLSTTEAREACGSISFLPRFLAYSQVHKIVRINSGFASLRGGARYGKARLFSICACMHLVYPCRG